MADSEQKREISGLRDRLLMGQEAYKEKYISCERLESKLHKLQLSMSQIFTYGTSQYCQIDLMCVPPVCISFPQCSIPGLATIVFFIEIYLGFTEQISRLIV